MGHSQPEPLDPEPCPWPFLGHTFESRSESSLTFEVRELRAINGLCPEQRQNQRKRAKLHNGMRG